MTIKKTLSNDKMLQIPVKRQNAPKNCYPIISSNEELSKTQNLNITDSNQDCQINKLKSQILQYERLISQRKEEAKRRKIELKKSLMVIFWLKSGEIRINTKIGKINLLSLKNFN